MKEATPEYILVEAQRVVDELVANGASLTYRAEQGGELATFVYELAAGGDRRRCRTLINDAKWRPALWAAVLAEIAARSEVQPHG